MKTTFNQFIGEAYKFKSLNFNSHTNHNPECDILEGHIDSDTFITYGIYVKGPKKGTEFMEYYSGSNYKVGSSKRSSSKMYDADKIPSKYKAMWSDLKAEYENNYAPLTESLVTESVATKLADKLMNMDYAAFKSLGLRSGGELYSNKMMQKKYVEAMKLAIDKAGIADDIAKNGQAIYDELEDNNYHSTNAFLVLGGYMLPKLVGMYKEISKSSPNSTLQPFNESLVTESKVTFHFEEFDNSLHFSDGAIVKIDYDGDFEYRGKWFTTESDVEKQLNKAFPTEKFIHETTKDK